MEQIEDRPDIHFSPGDRVRRTDGVSGPKGTVQNVRIESVRSSLKPNTSEQLGVAITVLWDNGTLSHFVPDGLEKVSE